MVRYPSINIYLHRVTHNAKIIGGRCAQRGISVVAVTKSVLGSTEVAQAIGAAQVDQFGDSRLKNLHKLNRVVMPSRLMLLRSPMLSEVEEMVKVCSTSLNTQAEVIEKINRVCRALKTMHQIIMMVSTDDCREGLMADQLLSLCSRVGKLDHIRVIGLGTNARCISSKKPSMESLSLLSKLRQEAEKVLGQRMPILSGGNSSLYPLITAGHMPPSINQVRIGEAIMLGHETSHYRPIKDAMGNCFELEAEIIQVKESGRQAVLALGIQDADASNIKPVDSRIYINGQSSDHTIIQYAQNNRFCTGDIVAFHMDYFGLLSSMTSPFVKKNYIRR